MRVSLSSATFHDHEPPCTRVCTRQRMHARRARTAGRVADSNAEWYSTGDVVQLDAKPGPAPFFWFFFVIPHLGKDEANRS